MIGAHKVIEQVGSTQSVIVKSSRIAGRGGSCVLTINEDGSYELNNHRSGGLLSVANNNFYPTKMTLLQIITINFANTRHLDPDKMSVEESKMILDAISRKI